MRGGHASRHRDDALLGMDQMSEERAPESNLDLPVDAPTDPGNGRVREGFFDGDLMEQDGGNRKEVGVCPDLYC